jgi:hypothetical protein
VYTVKRNFYVAQNWILTRNFHKIGIAPHPSSKYTQCCSNSVSHVGRFPFKALEFGGGILEVTIRGVRVTEDQC